MIFERDVEAEYAELVASRYVPRTGYMLRVQAAALRLLRQDCDLITLAKSLGLETWDVSRIMRVRWIFTPYQMTDFWDEHYIMGGPTTDRLAEQAELRELVNQIGVRGTAEKIKLSPERVVFILNQEPVTPFQIEDYSWYLPRLA